ncbi:MAG: TerB family tellurite resistance protein [Pseudomonadota bacterium]
MSAQALINQDFEDLQNYQEAVIKMMVLLYQVDGKVTLTELEFFDPTISEFDWQSGISIEAFVNHVIHEVRQAIDCGDSFGYLKSLRSALNHDSDSAFDIALKLTASDGRRGDDEKELLALLSNKVLAKGLVE